ncbi:MAG: hypothetical protein EKK37_10145 [Sphingobacteriales bacterium]|nr:MAG: hypothetical protein EKK37_10145 [Sphingobacteriales bacterium]
MKNTFFRLVKVSMVILISGALSCKKNTKLTPLDISGVLYTDKSGNTIGSYGNPAGDWTFSTTLSPQEISLLNFADSLDMTGTVVVSNPRIIPVYPNPSSTYMSFSGQFGLPSQLTKLKVVVVDPFYNIAVKDALIINGGNQQFYFSVANRQIFQPNGIYRIYYSLSAKDNPNYKMGYGAIQICPGYISTPNCP